MPRTAEILKIVLLIIAIQSGFAQQPSSSKSKKASTYHEYQSKSESVNVSQLLVDAMSLQAANPAEALNKVQEALAISVADGNSFNEAKCYLLIGSVNEQIKEWYLARENYQKAYRILSASYRSTAEFGISVRGLGKSNLELKDFEKALTYYQEALRDAKSTSPSQLKLDISEVYYQMGNYPEAKKTLDEIPNEKSSGNSFEILVQNQRRKIQARLNEPESNVDLYSNSLNSLRSGRAVEEQTQQSLSQTKEEIASTYRGQKRYDDEIDLRKQSIEFNLESNDLNEVVRDKAEISRTLEAKGESRAALKEMEDAARIADTINNPKAKADAFLSLAGLYEKNGRASQALDAYKKYSASVAEVEKANESRFQMKEKLLNKQQEIEELTNDISQGKQEVDLQAATVVRQQLIIYGLVGIIVIIVIATYFIYRSAQASKTANQMLALKSLRSQMNPHFIFNALNSVNHFIAQQDERSANKFLSEFSQLMRLVLDNSQQDFITLNKEQEMLALYMKLEHYRFRDKFDYEFNVPEEINGEAVELPPMLIQPYIENAVWHGLRYKESKGKLAVRFAKKQNEIEVEIEDDGIGRKKSAALKTANQKLHNSTGLKNIHERLRIINHVYHSNYRVAIEDLPNDAGTKVKIHLPINSNNVDA